MLIALLVLFIALIIAFGILSIVVQHLFLIGFFVAIVLLLAELGFLGSRHGAGSGPKPPEHA